MAIIRPKDEPSITTLVAGDRLIVDGATVRSIAWESFSGNITPALLGGLGTGVATFLATPSSANLRAALTDETGTGAAVFANNPTMIAPVLGAATATSINGNTFTTGTYTLTGAAGKTFTFSNTMTLAGTDGTTYTFPTTSATIARTDATQTFTGVQNFTGNVGITGGLTITLSSATSLFVSQGANAAFVVDTTTASSATGVSVKSAAAAGGVAIAAISSGTNEGLSINAKGSGTIAIGSISTGVVTITPNVTHTGTTTLSNAITYGGVTLSNSVTGTGSMVLSSGATLVGPALGTPTALVLTNATGIPTALAANEATAEAAVSTSTFNTPQGTAQAWIANVQTFGRNIAGRNGGLEVWQRLVGGATTVAVAASTTAYTVDGWYLYSNANQASTITRVAGLNNNSRYAAQVQRNSGQTGTTAMGFAFPLDTDELNKMNGNQVVLSFTVKAGANWSPTSGTLTYKLYTGTGANPAKRGASAYTGEANPLTGSVNITTSTARVVTALSTAVGTGVTQAEIQFTWTPVGTAGAADYFQIDDVQVEVVPAGIAAVNPIFERTDYALDLHRCQRFLPVFNSNGSASADIIGFGQAYATNSMFFVWTFSTPTRAPITAVVPSNVAHFTVANASSSTTAATAIALISGNNYTCSINVTPTGTPLVAGNASALESVSGSSQILFTGAEI